MDAVIGKLKTFFVTKSESRNPSIAPKAHIQPTMSELHDIDYDFIDKSSRAQPSTSTRGTVTQAPRMSSSASPTAGDAKASTSSTLSTENKQLRSEIRDPVYEKELDAAMKVVYEELAKATTQPDLTAASADLAHLPPSERLKLVLRRAEVTDQAKVKALMGLYWIAPDYPQSKALVDVGVLVFKEISDPCLFNRATPNFRIWESRNEQAYNKFQLSVETTARCEQARNGALEWITKSINGGYCWFDAHPSYPAALGALAEAAVNNHPAVVNVMLGHATERAKIEALVALTGAATTHYSTDPFVAVGRAIHQSLKEKESSFAEVRKQTMPQEEAESSMVTGFLHDISHD